MKTGAGDLEGVVERLPVVVDQQADQLREGDGRVGVVELDRDGSRQLRDVVMVCEEPPQDVGQGGGGEEVLLLQPQLLALLRGVVGVEHAADGLGQDRRGGGGHVVAPVEGLQLEFPHRSRGPQAQRVGPAPAPARNRRVVTDGQHGFRRCPGGAGTVGAHGPAEVDRKADLRPFELPGMDLTQPVLGIFDLPAVLEGLPEQPVVVANAVAVGGEAHGRHGVEEAGGETAEAAVAERGIGLVGEERAVVDAEVLDDCPQPFVEPQVGDGILEQPADEEFHRQVVDPLAVLGVDTLGRLEPGRDHEIADRPRNRQPPVRRGRGGRGLPGGVAQVVLDGAAQRRCVGQRGILVNLRLMSTYGSFGCPVAL